MAGTKMTLHRYGGRVQDWKDQLIVVDQAYLDNNDLHVKLNYPYELGNDLLEVYYNGQRLTSGGGFIEVDEQTIRIDLGTYEDGTPIGLEIGDEIYIKFWQNHYYNRGGNIPSATEVTNILKTIEEIVNYGGASNLDMQYEYNTKGQIIREVSTGSHNIIREFTYNAIGEIESETINFEGKIIRKTHEYDLDNFKLLKTTVRVLS